MRIFCHDCEKEMANASKKQTALRRAFVTQSAEGHLCTDGAVRCERCFGDWMRAQMAAIDAVPAAGV